MLRLKKPQFSLSDAYRYLAEHKFDIVRSIEAQDLEQLKAVNPQFKEPTHRVVHVFLDSAKQEPLVLLFNNLGQVNFSDGDCLDTFKLDEPRFYFDFCVQGDQQKRYQAHQVLFADTGKEWTATFDYATIFDQFCLDGTDDFAPFVGFYVVV